MWYLILSICILGLITAVGYAAGKKPVDNARRTIPAPPPAGCCGQHETCERFRLITAANRIEYYDDEELDRFRETGAGAYADDAVEEFREILYTLRPDETPGWLRSLRMRRINLPDALRDEALMIAGEQRPQPERRPVGNNTAPV
ncbi:MAG: phospholipase [Tannerellaceae bacterium]|jgi:hypothetical protein|nr:phospholipase [Tannerellaceae bacterium]